MRAFALRLAPSLLGVFLALPALAKPGTPSTVTTPLAYDARTLAMGGAGTALTESGAAGFNNPAAIASVRQTVATATFTPYLMKLTAPFTFANGSKAERTTGTLFGPFSQLGLNVRVNRRVVVGMTASISAAAGGTFLRVPLRNLSDQAPAGVVGNAQVAQVAGELRVPIAVQVTRWLTLAAAYRVTGGFARAKISNQAKTPLSEARMLGTNVSGFGLGVLAQPHPRLRLGLAYRSQISVDLSGTLKTFARTTTETALSQRAAIANPHELKVGASWRVPAAEALLLAAEWRVATYHLLNQNERNAFGGSLGAEYAVRRWAAVRMGYSVNMQPTTEAHAAPNAAPPGLGHGATLGGGLHLGDWLVDAGVGYLRSGKVVPAGDTAGTYRVRGFVASASASYAI